MTITSAIVFYIYRTFTDQQETRYLSIALKGRALKAANTDIDHICGGCKVTSQVNNYDSYK